MFSEHIHYFIWYGFDNHNKIIYRILHPIWRKLHKYLYIRVTTISNFIFLSNKNHMVYWYQLLPKCMLMYSFRIIKNVLKLLSFHTWHLSLFWTNMMWVNYFIRYWYYVLFHMTRYGSGLEKRMQMSPEGQNLILKDFRGLWLY